MFALLQTFPHIDEMYKQRTLTRLLEKEQWAVAATYAGQEVQCQVRYPMLLHIASDCMKHWLLCVHSMFCTQFCLLAKLTAALWYSGHLKQHLCQSAWRP